MAARPATALEPTVRAPLLADVEAADADVDADEEAREAEEADDEELGEVEVAETASDVNVTPAAAHRAWAAESAV